jgi:tetratricopeptide (TPR) repeat protein
MKGDISGILTHASSHLENFPTTNPNQLNDFAWFFYENAADKALLEKALIWSLKSIELSDVYPYNDTAASLYYKLGNKAKAKEMAEKAIKLAKEHNEDSAETQTLLRKIEAMK